MPIAACDPVRIFAQKFTEVCFGELTGQQNIRHATDYRRAQERWNMAHVLGTFTFRSMHTSETYNNAIYTDAVEYFYDHSSGEPLLRHPRSRKPVDDRTLTRFVDALLTRHHERVHFWQMVSTPIGLPILRLEYQRQAYVHTSYVKLLAQMRAYGIEELRIPIMGWLRSLEKGPSPLRDAMYLVVATDEVYQTFLLTFLGNERQTLDQALRHWEKMQVLFTVPSVSRILDQGQLLPIKTNLNREGKAIPWQGIATDCILECSARLQEVEFLKELGFEEGYLDRWLERMLFGSYRKPIEFIKHHLNWVNVKTMIAMLDLALMSPIDPVFFAAWAEGQLWEDVNPSWRLVQIVRQMAAIGPEKLAPLIALNLHQEFCELLCAPPGWLTPREISHVGVTFRYGGAGVRQEEDAGDAQITGDLTELTRAVTMMKEAFRLRLDHSHAFVWMDDHSVPATRRNRIEPLFSIIGGDVYLYDEEHAWNAFQSFIISQTLHEIVHRDRLEFGNRAFEMYAASASRFLATHCGQRAMAESDEDIRSVGEFLDDLRTNGFANLFRQNFGLELSEVRTFGG